MSDFTERLLGLQPGSANLSERFKDYVPVKYRRNCLYIVSAVLIENDKILLVKEAKQECYGELYLPAGKVKKFETLEDACERELEEESFIKGKVDHLVSINRRPQWFRFNFIGHRVGGRLKTLQDKDKDSLEAGWYLIDDLLSDKLELRSEDIIPVVYDAVEWLKKNCSATCLTSSVPIISPYSHLVQRLIICDVQGPDSIKVLVESKEKIYPIIMHNFMLDHTVETLFGVNVHVLGALSIEHMPSKNEDLADKHDGICLNWLCEFKSGGVENIYSNYEWLTLDNKFLSIFNNIKSTYSYITMD